MSQSPYPVGSTGPRKASKFDTRCDFCLRQIREGESVMKIETVSSGDGLTVPFEEYMTTTEIMCKHCLKGRDDE